MMIMKKTIIESIDLNMYIKNNSFLAIKKLHTNPEKNIKSNHYCHFLHDKENININH